LRYWQFAGLITAPPCPSSAEIGLWKYVGAGGSLAPNSVTRLRWFRCTAMILDGWTGGRCTAWSTATRRPSPATSSSPSRRTWTAAPSSKILRYSANEPPSSPQSLDRLRRPASGRSVEPEVHLAGPHRVFVVAERFARRSHRTAAQRGDHHQVRRELGLGPHGQELRHRVEHLGVFPGQQPVDPDQVGLAGLGGPDVRRVARLVRPQLAQRPERMRKSPRRDQQYLAVESRDRGADRPAGSAEVLGVAGVRGVADRDPLLVQAAAEEGPQVHCRVVHG